MTALLIFAVRLLRPLVEHSGEMRSVSISDAGRILGLSSLRTNEVIGELEMAGFVIFENGQVSPTVAGLELGHQIARSARQTQDLELSPRGPYWTYFPEEVDLRG